MAFGVYEVVCVTCLSRSWFVYTTSHANDFVNAKCHEREKPLFAGYSSFFPHFGVWFQAINVLPSIL